ncbi:MAG: NAD(P)(+) transhydrogenase (Re/Si-specific) subunit alpha, partial [Gammaproteobacteria bacterium]|nr:NAD(P)(+) transhydrogenase (Re/Si-specific) subunit alpha [Gammaproteobacteria bacterium]
KQASTLYANNLLRLTEELCKSKDGSLDINFDDEVIRGTTVIKAGEVTWPPPAPRLSAAPAPAKAAGGQSEHAKTISAPKKSSHGHGAAAEPASIGSLLGVFGVGALLFWLVGAYAPPSFVGHFTVFVLACFIGYMVIWNVTPSLHTPLMSVTNAISSIIAVGALVQIAPPLADDASRNELLIRVMAVSAILLTAINMFGGFAVTRRMLAMFRK